MSLDRQLRFSQFSGGSGGTSRPELSSPTGRSGRTLLRGECQVACASMCVWGICAPPPPPPDPVKRIFPVECGNEHDSPNDFLVPAWPNGVPPCGCGDRSGCKNRCLLSSSWELLSYPRPGITIAKKTPIRWQTDVLN